MEHANPILLGNNSPQKFITIGEVMLRLTPPNYEKIRMASSFEASYGGSEANIALALANLGVDSTFFSVVPNNSLGKSAIRWLRCNDVHCTPMILSSKEETPSCRLGTYYLETGYGIRPSKVIYDRMHSALTEYDLAKVDLQELFEGFDWLHLSGITPALNKNCADFILRCLREPKEMGLTVSFDGNFRSSLWTWEEARDYCTQCLPYVDVLFGIEPYQQMKTLARLGLLGNFIGMLTDSRSFLSYTRHDYFRRILCNIIGQWVEDGEYPNDEKALEKIVKGICFDNAKRYFAL